METPSDQDQFQKNVFLITSALHRGALAEAASGVVVTTVTEVFGFSVFLGLATLFLFA